MIHNFIKDWLDKGIEKSDTQLFWLALLRDVLGVNKPDKFIQFEKTVELSHTSFIDSYILIDRNNNRAETPKRKSWCFSETIRRDISPPLEQAKNGCQPQSRDVI